ncbi:MAG: sensor histidine kinase [Porcipelethomonas sp.]
MKKIKADLIIYPLLIVLSAVLIFVMISRDTEAMEAIPLRVTFQGEYKTGDSSWQEISEGKEISFKNGEVRLKGYFQIETDDGEVIGQVPKGMSIITYFDHIGGQIETDDWISVFDMENKALGDSTCGEDWVSIECPVEENETVEIVLTNPHKYGNSDAVNTFLESMHLYSGNGAAFEHMMSEEGSLQRNAGIVIMVVSFIVLGVAIFSSIIKVPHSRILWIFGLMLLAAGGFCILDSSNFCLYGNSTIFNTTAKHLCIILYPVFVFLLSANCMRNKLKKIGSAVAGICGILSIGAVIVAITGKVLIYDLNYYLMMVQFSAALILTVLCALSFKGADKKQNIMILICLVSLLALCTDIFAVISGIWGTAVVSKAVFAAVFISALVYSLKIIPTNIKSSIHEKELLLELRENRISITLSQIQPHFLNNVLSTIRGLCDSDTEKARDALVDFSLYLRENMDSIKSSEPIRFERELSHIKTYIKLEKLRFGDKINVVYDITESDFAIQPLTIQPIVENAVKHGISRKEEGGTITLKTAEENGFIIISVADDGVGFDVHDHGMSGDSRSHVGLENVKSRVESYPGGKFTVESEKGKGTIVTICFRR